MGWDVATLQNAIINCNNQTPDTAAGKAEGCQYFQMQTPDAASKCTIAPQVNEATTGVLAKLPGCNPIQAGAFDRLPFAVPTS